MKQVWRPYDKITTADGIPGKVLGVSFSTKSVRAFISGAPEWVNCTLIETHTTGKGADGDDAAIIEGLHNKVLLQDAEIEKQRGQIKKLNDVISHDHCGELLKAVNQLQQGVSLRKSKIEKIEKGIELIFDFLSKMESEE